MKTRVLFLAVLLLSAYPSFPARHKHKITLKDVSQDLAAVSDELALAGGQVPAGSTAAVYLSLAQQQMQTAQQDLVEVASKGCAENK